MRMLLIDTLQEGIKRDALAPVSIHLRRYRRARGEALHLLWQENKGEICSCCLFAWLFFLFYLKRLFLLPLWTRLPSDE